MTKVDTGPIRTARRSTSIQHVRTRRGTARRGGTRFRDALLGLTGVLLFLAMWETVPRAGLVNQEFLPPVSDVLAVLGDLLGSGRFWGAVSDTMTAWALGLLIATVFGVVLGFLIGSSRFLRKATHSTVEFLRPIPSVALIPLAVLVFGVGIESTLLLVVYAAFWQVLIQVLYGVADVDTVAIDTARSYGFPAVARVRHVVLPSTLPYLIIGIRLAAAIALILAVTSELVIGSPGLGREIALAQSGGSSAKLYALVMTTGLIGVFINIAVRVVEKRLLHWHASTRAEVAQ